jgi:hypothetical protein
MAGFKEMGGKAMAKRMAPDVLYNAVLPNSFLHGTLQDRLVNVVAAFLTGLRVLPTILLREYPLPVPLGGGVWVQSIQGIARLHTHPPISHVFFMNRFAPSKTVWKWRFNDGQSLGLPRTDYLSKVAYLGAQDMTVQKVQRGKGLVLG